MISEYSSTPQRENIEYDASDHPLYIKKSTLSDYSTTLSAICHYHDDIEFMYLLKGHISYNVNGEIYEIAEGEGIVSTVCPDGLTSPSRMSPRALKPLCPGQGA